MSCMARRRRHAEKRRNGSDTLFFAASAIIPSKAGTCNDSITNGTEAVYVIIEAGRRQEYRHGFRDVDGGMSKTVDQLYSDLTTCQRRSVTCQDVIVTGYQRHRTGDAILTLSRRRKRRPARHHIDQVERQGRDDPNGRPLFCSRQPDPDPVPPAPVETLARGDLVGPGMAQSRSSGPARRSLGPARSCGRSWPSVLSISRRGNRQQPTPAPIPAARRCNPRLGWITGTGSGKALGGGRAARAWDGTRRKVVNLPSSAAREARHPVRSRGRREKHVIPAAWHLPSIPPCRTSDDRCGGHRGSCSGAAGVIDLQTFRRFMAPVLPIGWDVPGPAGMPDRWLPALPCRKPRLPVRASLAGEARAGETAENDGAFTEADGKPGIGVMKLARTSRDVDASSAPLTTSRPSRKGVLERPHGVQGYRQLRGRRDLGLARSGSLRDAKARSRSRWPPGFRQKRSRSPPLTKAIGEQATLPSRSFAAAA